ncbi:MAG TPA: EAL domain-containing protein [Solirubrobacteraceae bacterium]|nr:EAL domain-containing protein [Solirubrobacteraceae bacterium]
MRGIPKVRIYCEAIFLISLAAVALLIGDLHLRYVLDDPLTFAVLAGGVILGEMLPVKIPRRGDDEELTLSASFAMALLLLGGLGPALVAQGVASILQDVMSKKPPWRVRFNLGQYSLSMVAAWLAIRLVAVSPRLDVLHPFASRQLPAMLLGATAFFLVNAFVVGSAVAAYQNVPVIRYFRGSVTFVMITGGVVLLVAPIVLAAAAYTVVIVPLCLAPVLAMYNSVHQSARSEHEARHDALTGLPNRTAFHEVITGAIEDASVPAAILLMDLDRFKEVNDTLGHRYGDLLLVQVAQRFNDVIRGRGQIARLGGDEFAVISPGADRSDATALAHRIADALRDPFELEEMVVDVQASVGIALFPEHGNGVETLLQKADVAMYRAKETRSDVALYDERHDHHSPAKLALTAELRTAVASEEIVLWYQPELDLRTREVLAVEALVRWDHPRLGVLPPSSFVRMAEATNLIKPLTQRVMEVALLQVADWHALGLEIGVAVNISAQVLVDQTFTGQVVEALRRTGVTPHRLKLEVTETALMSDPVTARTVLRELEALGCEISIDDFGTGYSSLAYLADLPVSEVKIDRSFVSRMSAGSSEKVIVNSTIDLAHHLGLRAVAEGVEDWSMLPELEALGCDAAQGYAISHPLAGQDATRWLLDFRSTSGGDPALTHTPAPVIGQAA